MAKDLRKAIDELSGKLSEIANFLAQNTRLADEAFTTINADKIKLVRQNHERIEKKSGEFEEDCMKVLALYQPVARDLRHIMTLFKVSIDLERMSALSERIASKTRRIAKTDKAPAVPAQLKSYFHETADLLDAGAKVLQSRDIATVKALIEQGTSLYKLRRRLRQQFQDSLEQEPINADFYVTLSGIARHLGRLANLVAEICEEILEYHQGTTTAV